MPAGYVRPNSAAAIRIANGVQLPTNPGAPSGPPLFGVGAGQGVQAGRTSPAGIAGQLPGPDMPDETPWTPTGNGGITANGGGPEFSGGGLGLTDEQKAALVAGMPGITPAPGMEIPMPGAPGVPDVTDETPTEVARGIPAPTASGQIDPATVTQAPRTGPQVVGYSKNGQPIYNSPGYASYYSMGGGGAGADASWGSGSGGIASHSEGGAPSLGQDNASVGMGTKSGINTAERPDMPTLEERYAMAHNGAEMPSQVQMVKAGTGHYVRQRVHNSLGGSGFTVEKTWQPDFIPAGSAKPPGGPQAVPPPIGGNMGSGGGFANAMQSGAHPAIAAFLQNLRSKIGAFKPIGGPRLLGPPIRA
jgi:hypothetical protein